MGYMRSLKQLETDYFGTKGFLNSMLVDANNAEKLDIVIELLFAIHKQQQEAMERIAKAIEDRRYQ